MRDKVIGESVTFRIEVEDRPKCVLLVFDRKCDYAIVPWEDAFQLAKTMEQVIADVSCEFSSVAREVTLREQAQVRLNHHKGLVAIVIEWTDRIRFTSLEAFMLVATAMRKTAQDANLEMRGVRFKYDLQGMIQKIMNKHTGITQQVR